jgi:diguanylate cyclase (GGDEF)-like protein
MAQLPEQVRKRFRELARNFFKGLPDRLVEIEKLVQQLGQPGSDQNTLRQLNLQVHKLTGTGASFGFDAVSSSARAMEELLRQPIGKERGLADPEKRTLAALLEELRAAIRSLRAPEAEQESGTEIASVEPAIQPGGERVICLLREDVLLNTDFADQIGIFGLPMRLMDDIAEIDQLIAAGKQVILVMDVEHFAGSDDKLQRPQLHIVLLAERDDFNTRLRGIRAGGDAFFTFPVDIGQFIDKIYGLAGPGDEHPYHILIVDDDPEQLSYLAMILQNAGMITSLVTDPRSIIKVLVEARPDLILMDMYMPSCTGIELAALIRQQDAFVGIPIVFHTVENDLKKRMEAIKIGADDFLVKPLQPDHLIASLKFRAERTRNIRFFMERDSLTGLLSHAHLKERLAGELERARRIGNTLSFAMTDLDHFKNVNDTYGHLTGDRVIKSLTRMLQERLRKTDIIGRYGGEEFGVILFNTDGLTAARRMNDLRESFSRIRQHEGRQEFFCTFSCGVAAFPGCQDAARLCEEADKSLYMAKREGRNRVVCSGSPPIILS